VPGCSARRYSGGGDRLAEVASGELKRLAMHAQQLAWARCLRELGRQRSRGVLYFQVQPAVFGGSVKVGAHQLHRQA